LHRLSYWRVNPHHQPAQALLELSVKIIGKLHRTIEHKERKTTHQGDFFVFPNEIFSILIIVCLYLNLMSHLLDKILMIAFKEVFTNMSFGLQWFFFNCRKFCQGFFLSTD